MAITLITPHQRRNSGGVYVLEQLARHAAAVTEVHLVVVKGAPVPIPGVHVHGGRPGARLALPPADALVIPADMRRAEPLFGLSPDRGAPMLLFQGYGTPHDAVAHANLVLASHAICVSSWLLDEAVASGCTATVLRLGLDREIFAPGPPTEERGPVVAMMTHPLDWKGTADGLRALKLAREVVPELEVRLFGKLEPDFPGASYLPAPNRPEEVAELMRGAAVFVSSSWEEGFGFPGIEAIASGAALATTDTKGSRDYAFHDRTALVSPPRDPEALALNIVELLRNPELRGLLVRSGRSQIEAIHPAWPEVGETFVSAAEEGARAVASVRGWHAKETVDSLRREARRARALQQAAETEREELASELVATTRALTRTHELVAELQSELDLSAVQRRRLQAALARARADAQLAEAERAALHRRAAELSALLERSEPELERNTQLKRNAQLARAQAVVSAAGAPHPRIEQELAAAVAQLPSAARAWPPLPEAERETQATFEASYSRLLALVPATSDGRDPLALPFPLDPCGMLASEGEDQGAGVASVDVVVCVHNALEHLRTCLWSLAHKAGRRFRLIVVDDGSDEPTSAFLAEIAAALPAITLIDHPDPPHGYTIAANLGLTASSSDYVVMLNSDTIVTYGWLERIVAHGERHPQVGILGPLSNAATHQSVPDRRSNGEWATNPLPDWLTADGMALLLERAGPRTDARLPFINGFCLVVKRAVVTAIGSFDEQLFGPGYAEESDYEQRARAAGFELGVVDDAFVYHAKSQSYGDVAGKAVARRAYQTFLDKHGAQEIDRLVREMEADMTLEPVRAAVRTTTASQDATAAALAAGGGPRLSVVFVLPGIADGGSGGSHSIYQEVHGLRRLGVAARIALHEREWERASAIYDDADDVFQRFGGADELAGLTADASVIVATHFKAVSVVAALCRQRDDFLPAYYVQDYEPMFTFADPADNEEAAASYTAIPGALLFAKTHWLCNIVSRTHGVFVAKVEPSIDEQLYRPAATTPAAAGGPLRIAAMVRPRTARRQATATVSVLQRLLERLGDEIQVTTFGCREPDLAKITKATAIHSAHVGLLKRDRVAELLARSDVFLDMSTYQAFGRTALEAMACGCTAVVPRVGGVWDFARDGQNLLAIDTLDRDEAFEAVAGLAADRQRLVAMKAAARATGGRYSILRAALSEYVVLQRAYRARTGD